MVSDDDDEDELLDDLEDNESYDCTSCDMTPTPTATPSRTRQFRAALQEVPTDQGQNFRYWLASQQIPKSQGRSTAVRRMSQVDSAPKMLKRKHEFGGPAGHENEGRGQSQGKRPKP